jgi:hypothetical protein
MKGSLLVISLTALMLTASSVFSQSRAGLSAAPELLIPVGAQYEAMAGSANAFVTGVDAIYWNPAGLDMSGTSGSALFSYRQYIAGIGVDYVAVGGNLGFGSLGLSLRSFNIGTINVTTEDQPDGTGQQLSPTFFIGGLTYSKKLTDKISIGATVNLIEESFGSVSASAIGFDAGVQYQDLIGIKGLAIGVTVKNVGTDMQYGGSGLYVQATIPSANVGLSYYKLEAASFQLPSVIDIGLGYKKALDEDNAFEMMATYENNNYGIDEYRAGAEYNFMNTIAIRAGYVFSQTGGAFGSNAGTVSIFENWTLGAGIDLNKLTGVGISFNYAYVPVRYFGSNNMFDVRILF